MSQIAFDCANCGDQVFVAAEQPYHACPGCGAVYHDGMDLNTYDADEFESGHMADAADAEDAQC